MHVNKQQNKHEVIWRPQNQQTDNVPISSIIIYL